MNERASVGRAMRVTGMVALWAALTGGCAALREAPQPSTRYEEGAYRGQIPADTHQQLREAYPPQFWKSIGAVPSGKRLRIGVMLFVGPAIWEDLCRKATDTFYTEFTKSGAFRMYERTQQNKLVQEFQLNQTGLIDASTAKNVGQQIGIDLLVLGSVYRAEADEARLDVRVIDIETGEAVIADAMVRALTSRNTSALARRVVSRIVERYYKKNADQGK